MKPEVLAPAGSMEALKAAVMAGADAIYLGGNQFGARAFANNFDENELIDAIKYCHLYGVKVYLTINTLFRNEEILQLYDYLCPLYEVGLDAVIVQDLGVVYYIHNQFPDLPIHASTQMTITTPYAYEMLYSYGVTRVVPARELSLGEIAELKNGEYTPEVEVFVQGALCYCYSGQCLMSSFLGGRSGNRGRCAQTCRLPYTVMDKDKNELQIQGEYVLSPKDLCGLDSIPGLIEAGVDSFKIEGRMKNPFYVAVCVASYRKIVDAYYDGTYSKELVTICKNNMAAVFNRGGFTSGYYNNHNGKDMMSTKTPGNIGVKIGKIVNIKRNQITISLTTSVEPGDILSINGKRGEITLTCNVSSKANENIVLNAPKTAELCIGLWVNRMRSSVLQKEFESYLVSEDTRKIDINGSIKLVTGERARLELYTTSGDFVSNVLVEGQLVEPASKQPVTREQILDKICKIGNTRFVMQNMEIQCSTDAFYSMKLLKEMRRQALEQLELQIIKQYYRKAPLQNGNEDGQTNETDLTLNEQDQINYNPIIMISSKEQWEYIYNSYDFLKDCYIDLQYFSIEDIICLIQEYSDVRFWIVLPSIMRKDCMKDIDFVINMQEENVEGLVIRNIDEFAYVLKNGYSRQLVADYGLYTMNRLAEKFALEQNANIRLTLPVELNEKQISKHLKNELTFHEMIVYGYQQLMVSAQCIQSTAFQCNKENAKFVMLDRYDKEFFANSICKYCYSLIYNGLPTYIYDLVKVNNHLKNCRLRVHFTRENEREITEVLQSIFSNKEYQGTRTRGHYNRGVD